MPLARKETTNSCGGQARLQPQSPPETSRLPATPPAPSLRPGSSEGCSDSAEPPKGTERVLFSLGESASPNTCAFPPPPWLARSRTGTKGPVARHPPNRKFHLSGQLPGHRGQWSGPRAETKRGRCGPSSCRRARAPRPRTAPAKPAALAPAPAPCAHLRPRAVLESGAEVLGAPSALATPIALHGPGGGSRVSEAWSPRAAGSHRRRVRWVAGRAGRRRRGVAGAGGGESDRRPGARPAAVCGAGLARLFLSRAGSFRVWPPGPPRPPPLSPPPFPDPPPSSLGNRLPPVKRGKSGQRPAGDGDVRCGGSVGGGHEHGLRPARNSRHPTPAAGCPRSPSLLGGVAFPLSLPPASWMPAVVSLPPSCNFNLHRAARLGFNYHLSEPKQKPDCPGPASRSLPRARSCPFPLLEALAGLLPALPGGGGGGNRVLSCSPKRPLICSQHPLPICSLCHGLIPSSDAHLARILVLLLAPKWFPSSSFSLLPFFSTRSWHLVLGLYIGGCTS